jgi:uncharacterized protein (DUF427 family)
MTLTVGSGPFGHNPAGEFNVEIPTERILLFEPFPRRMRASAAGEQVLDSRRGRLLYEHGVLPRCYFPRADVRMDLLARTDEVSVSPIKDVAVGHVRDPYHRVDVLPSSRHVIVRLADEVLAESRRARVIYETGLPPRWYFPVEDVVAELRPTELETVCAYKGFANYWTVRAGDDAHVNLAWTYREPLHDAAAVADHVAFFNERVEIEVDAEVEPPVRTPWSDPDWWKA